MPWGHCREHIDPRLSSEPGAGAVRIVLLIAATVGRSATVRMIRHGQTLEFEVTYGGKR